MKDKSLHILLVEDDKYFRLGIKDILHKYGVILEADSLESAKELLNNQKVDLALIDIHLGQEPLGLDVLCHANRIGIPSIVLSSCDDDNITEQAYDAGCEHFLIKRHFREHLEGYILNIIKNIQGNLLEEFFQNKFITQDTDTIRNIKGLCEINLKGKTIFISGETGVGKSLIGRLLHSLNFNEKAPFVHLNCSEIPEELLEAELFGAKKGSFTGCDKDRMGRLKQADGGILFLDEIATMSKAMQQKLLKAIDEKTFYPIGSPNVERSNFTLISATCEDLFEKVSNQSFRKDLFFRINGINLDIKPLRERRDDINLLSKHFLKVSPRKIVIKHDALEVLKTYDWPGNIRELQKVIEVLTSTSKGIIRKKDLPLSIQNVRNSEIKYSDSEEKSLLTKNQKEYISKNGLKLYMKELEKIAVSTVLKENNGKIAKSIKDLKISSSAFYRVMESLN